MEHIHTWKKVKTRAGAAKRWMCADPHCFFTIEDALVIGKVGLCNRCHTNELIMNSYNRQLAAPVCDECSPRAAIKQVTPAARDRAGDLIRNLNFKEKPKNVIERDEDESSAIQGSLFGEIGEW